MKIMNYEALGDRDLLIPDGSGMVMAARSINKKSIKKIAGADLHKFLLKSMDKKGGIVVNDINELSKGFENILENYINTDIAKYCRKRYLENFSLEQFEENLIKIMK